MTTTGARHYTSLSRYAWFTSNPTLKEINRFNLGCRSRDRFEHDQVPVDSTDRSKHLDVSFYFYYVIDKGLENQLSLNRGVFYIS